MSARLKDAAPASSGRLPNAALAGFVPRLVNGVLELPVYHMRGGTSTGVDETRHEAGQRRVRQAPR